MTEDSKNKLAAVEESCKRKLEEMDKLSDNLGLIKALVVQMKKDETWQWIPKIDDKYYGLKWEDPADRDVMSVQCWDGEYWVQRHGTELKTGDPQKVLDFARPSLEALNSPGRRNLARELKRCLVKSSKCFYIIFDKLSRFADKFPALRIYPRSWINGMTTTFLVVLEEGKEFLLSFVESSYRGAFCSVPDDAMAFLD